MFQRTDVMLESTAFAKVKAPSCYWMHLLSVDEFDAACVLCSFGDDQRTYVLTPGQPVPMLRLGETGEPTMRDLRLRLPYGPRSRATLMFQLREPNPYQMVTQAWEQKWPIDTATLGLGGLGDANNMITVPCRGMRSGILSLRITSATQANALAFASIFAGVEPTFGAATEFYRRTSVVSLIPICGPDTSYGRNRDVSFTVPPGCDWLRVRAWRYNAAVNVLGSLTLASGNTYADGGRFSDGGQYDIPANAGATYFIGGLIVQDRSPYQRTIIRYRCRNDGASVSQTSFQFHAWANVGQHNNNDLTYGPIAPAAVPVAIGGTSVGATVPYPADAWTVAAIGAIAVGQNVGDFHAMTA